MWRLPGCSPEEFLVARRLAVRTHPVHHKLHSGSMIYNGTILVVCLLSVIFKNDLRALPVNTCLLPCMRFHFFYLCIGITVDNI